MRNVFRLSGKQRVGKHFIDRHVAFSSDDLTEFAVFVARGECCEIQHIFQKNVRIDLDLCCRGIAGISQVEDQMESGVSIGIEKQAPIIPHVNSNPRPLTCNQSSFGNINGSSRIAGLIGGCFSRQFNLAFASDPKFIGRQPKSDSGDSQNYSEGSNDALVVAFKERIDSLESERRSHMEGGAVFFVIEIGGLLTVLWLYQAQR